MSNEVQRLVASYQSSPPVGSRALAIFRRDLWEAYPPTRRIQLRTDNNKRPFYPELPALNNALGYLCDILLRAETDGLDVTPCWSALDADVATTFVREVYCKARQALRLNPTLAFAEHLEKLLGEGHQESPSGMPPRRRRRRSQAAPVATTPAAVPTVAASVVSYGAPHDEWLRAATSFYNVSVADFVRHCIAQVCKDLGFVDFVERAQKGAAHFKPASPAAPPAAPTAPPPAPPKAKIESKPEPTPKAAPQAKATPHPKAKPAAAKAPAPAPEPEKLPKLHERLRIVLGKDDVGIPEAIERLRARGPDWVPDSGDLAAYISLTLSVRKSLFQRVRRGIYRVRGASVDLKEPEESKDPEDSEGFEGLLDNIISNPFSALGANGHQNASSQPS